MNKGISFHDRLQFYVDIYVLLLYRRLIISKYRSHALIHQCQSDLMLVGSLAWHATVPVWLLGRLETAVDRLPVVQYLCYERN
jgi:hypothetical protein